MYIHDYTYVYTLVFSEFHKAKDSIYKRKYINMNRENNNIFSKAKRKQMINDMIKENIIYDCKASGSYYSIYNDCYNDCNISYNYFSYLSKRRVRIKV